MNEKQQQLTFDKGITNVPSDALCSDNALEESLGMVYDDGEHRVIQKPVGKFPADKEINGKILYVHKFDNKERFIALTESHIGTVSYQYSLHYYDETGSLNENWVYVLQPSSANDIQVTSIGKTLIISDEKGLHYYIWNSGGYTEQKEIPEPSFQFRLTHNLNDLVLNKCSDQDMIELYTDNGVSKFRVANGKQEDWNNAVTGIYAKNKRQIAQKKCFCLPFFVRTALELYDGSYTHISNPILLFPSVTENTIYMEGDWELSAATRFCKLKFDQSTPLSDLSDIVKDIVIFASPGIEIHDVSVDQKAENVYDGYAYYDMVSSKGVNLSSYLKQSFDPFVESVYHNRSGNFTELGIVPLVRKPESEINEGIKGTSTFYKLCSIGLNVLSNKDIADYIDTHTLENLTTQEFLKEDDYYSRCHLTSDFIYTYNSRLNLAGVKRGFFDGFKFFTPFEGSSGNDLHVYIKTDSGYKKVSQKEATVGGALIYFFYPDSRAEIVDIGNKTYKLTEHPSLNGAYYFAGIGVVKSIPFTEADSDGTAPTSSNITEEALPNYIIQSEVNNPWLFRAAGYFKVGTGKIIGMSSTTQALSEGQFGQYPLLVFSQSGIWALSVASTGYYDSVHPMSREVALENNPCLTQTDGAVFFASKKGLMVVAGNQVKCVSEQLSGKRGVFDGVTALGNFNSFLESAIIAYDYRDSLLWIFNKSNTACWVYSIKSGTFGKYDFGTTDGVDNVVNNVVNYYPDYLLQYGTKVLSLIDRSDINVDNGPYSGTIITRPMKLENALALKSIMQIRHIYDMSATSKMTLRIFASNNLKTDANTWAELHSLRGTPWKYYRFRFDFSDMKATDRFSGTMLITQERRTNKLR